MEYRDKQPNKELIRIGYISLIIVVIVGVVLNAGAIWYVFTITNHSIERQQMLIAIIFGILIFDLLVMTINVALAYHQYSDYYYRRSNRFESEIDGLRKALDLLKK